jgi:hypothetical protein
LPELPEPTTAVIVLELTTFIELAGIPPNLTSVAPLKLDPLMVIVAPMIALVGEKLDITGGL